LKPGNLLSPKRKKNSGEDRLSPGSWLDLALQTALTLAIAVVAGFFGGRWLDAQFHSTPVFVIIGTLWGAGGGTVWVIIKIKHFSETLERRDAEQDKTDQAQ